ncbi:hypothetical protein [Bacillus sp. AK128]
MSKKLMGLLLVITSATVMVINVTYFKDENWYDLVRWITCAIFLVGFVIIPNYSKPKN